MYGFPVSGRRFRLSRSTLQLVEMGDQLRVCVSTKKVARKKLAKGRRVPPPAFPDQSNQGLIFLRIVTGTCGCSAAVSSIEHKTTDSFLMLVGVCRCRPSAF